jgi:hypothetical protein
MAAVSLSIPGVARAQEAPPAASAPSQDAPSRVVGPNMGLVGSGLVLLGGAYVPSVVVAAASHLDADRALFVPVAGPWIDLAQRPGCAPNTSCAAENGARVGIVVDGVFQGMGLLGVLAGFVWPAHETTKVANVDLAPTLHVSPAQVGGSGYGMIAAGSF